MNTLSIEINDVIGSMIRLDQLSFAWHIWKILPSPEQALTDSPRLEDTLAATERLWTKV